MSRPLVGLRLAAPLLSATLLCILAGCSHVGTANGESKCTSTLAGGTGSHSASAAISGRRDHSIIWIVPQSLLQNYTADGKLIIDRALDNDHTYIYGAPPAAIGLATAWYSSYAQIVTAFENGSLPGRYKAVIYDNERWLATPTREQQDPVYYEKLVAKLLHKHGLIYIAAPTPDLMWAIARPRDSYRAYLERNVAGNAARYADVIDIQGQVRETNLREFKAFVTSAVRQARSANPHVTVLIGLRTNPGAQKLLTAYHDVVGLANGYWLNVNGRPQVAISFLRQIYCS